MTLLKKATVAVFLAVYAPLATLKRLRTGEWPESNPAGLAGDGADTVTSFEATEPDRIEYRPTTDTLEAAAAETSEYNVYTERRVEIDPDRLEEWVRANYDDETRVDIETKHGTDVYSRGERVDRECPVCGESTSLIQGFGATREYHHFDREETCTLAEVGDSAE